MPLQQGSGLRLGEGFSPTSVFHSFPTSTLLVLLLANSTYLLTTLDAEEQDEEVLGQCWHNLTACLRIYLAWMEN